MERTRKRVEVCAGKGEGRSSRERQRPASGCVGEEEGRLWERKGGFRLGGCGELGLCPVGTRVLLRDQQGLD